MAEKKTESLFLNRLEECKYPKADIGKDDVKFGLRQSLRVRISILCLHLSMQAKERGKMVRVSLNLPYETKIEI